MFTSIKQLEEETIFVKMQVVKDCKESNIRRVCLRSCLTFSYIRLFDVLFKIFSQMSTNITVQESFDNLKSLYKREFGVKAGKKQ